ncbi:MAG: hypothetical protein WCT49_02335 [Candidatus Paceibacterota bacterium]|jgi:hypothetical protein|nr:hypothetical protein [Candidatus Paceibacterota bacterium]
MEPENERYAPEIKRLPEEGQYGGQMPGSEVLPGQSEIIPEKQRTPDHDPMDIGEIVGPINENEKKDQERREQVEEIIRKRDEPKKKIH